MATKIKSWYVYILQCRDGTFYTGSTTDIERRLNEHNSGKGGNYTRVRRPVKIIYKKSSPDRSSAQKIEAQIKGLKRKDKIALIRGDFDERKQ